MEGSALQLLKALESITVTDSGILMEVKYVQLPKTHCPMLVISDPLVNDTVANELQ